MIKRIIILIIIISTLFILSGMGRIPDSGRYDSGIFTQGKIAEVFAMGVLDGRQYVVFNIKSSMCFKYPIKLLSIKLPWEIRAM